MPIWSRQTTNTLSGQDTWRCVTCHGWDYQGKDGAYRSGSNYTGFPSVYKQVQDMSEDEIVAHLKGSKDLSHDFSAYIDDASLNDLAKSAAKMSLVDYANIIAGSRRDNAATKGNDILGDGTDWSQAKLYIMISSRQMPMGRPADTPQKGPIIHVGTIKIFFTIQASIPFYFQPQV